MKDAAHAALRIDFPPSLLSRIFVERLRGSFFIVEHFKNGKAAW